MKLNQLDAFIQALEIDLKRERADRIYDTLVGAQYKPEDANKEINEFRGTK